MLLLLLLYGHYFILSSLRPAVAMLNYIRQYFYQIRRNTGRLDPKRLGITFGIVLPFHLEVEIYKSEMFLTLPETLLRS